MPPLPPATPSEAMPPLPPPTPTEAASLQQPPKKKAPYKCTKCGPRPASSYRRRDGVDVARRRRDTVTHRSLAPRRPGQEERLRLPQETGATARQEEEQTARDGRAARGHRVALPGRGRGPARARGLPRAQGRARRGGRAVKAGARGDACGAGGRAPRPRKKEAQEATPKKDF